MGAGSGASIITTGRSPVTGWPALGSSRMPSLIISRSMAATAWAISAGSSRVGAPASKVTAGMPTLVAATRSMPRLPGLCSTTVAPKPRVNSSTSGFVRSARTCGRLLRSKEPVWKSTSTSQCLTMSWKKALAMREAIEPLRLPGKWRLRSRRSGR